MHKYSTNKYLKKRTQPEIAYAVHQYSRFSKDPTKLHGEVVNSIRRYLKVTDKFGIFIFPHYINANIWVDADISSNWFPEEAKYDSYVACSISGFVVSHWDV